MNPIVELRSEVAGLRNQIDPLRSELSRLSQVLSGFNGFGGLINAIGENTKRLDVLERQFERVKGGAFVVAGIWSIVVSIITTIVANLFSR